jgi:hypothetical protein
MRYRCTSVRTLALLILTGLLPGTVWGHCDGMDGPVVKAGQRALDSGEVKFALSWVQKSAETEVTTAFEKTIAVRKLSPQAKDLADQYFFETLVRVHRMGEGEAYTGLKPAGRDLGPAIPAADKAIETGSPKEVIELIAAAAREGVERRLAEAMHAKEAAGGSDDVEIGRRYVQAYVTFLHHVERLYDAAAAHAGAHESEAASAQERHNEH